MLSFTDPFTHVLIECLLYVLGIKDPEVGGKGRNHIHLRISCPTF